MTSELSDVAPAFAKSYQVFFALVDRAKYSSQVSPPEVVCG